MDIEQGDRVGEVIEASTDLFSAQAYQLYEAPPLGSLVRAGTDAFVYGVVCYTTTRGVDPNRRPIARGQHLPSENSIYKENPQLEHLLRTEFSTVMVGYQDGQSVRLYLPPSPPRIHAFVYLCSSKEIRGITSNLGFLDLLLNSRNASDDAVGALVRLASLHYDDPKRFIVRAGKELAVLLQGQATRLNGVLRRLE